MEIRFYLRMVQRGWWLIVVSALIAVNFSLIYSYYIIVPQYEAVARFIVSPNLQNIESRDLVNSRQIYNGTLELLNKRAEEFAAYTTSVTVLPDANIIRYAVRGPDPVVTAQLANSVGQYAIDYVRKLYVIYDIDFLDKANTPLEPYRPQPTQDASLALLIGIVFGVGLAIFRDQFSSTLDRLKQRRMIDDESQAFTRGWFGERMGEE